jgi:hypothetical protein
MTTTDLSRIPEVYRERVQRLVTAARNATLCATNVNDPHAAVAPFLKIADEAEGAAARQYTMTCAGGGYTPGDQIPETMRLVCEGSANAARAKVWADELAKLDAPAEPPPGYWSTGVAVERKADPASDDDTVPPDLAADAVRAVRAAQRAHLDSTSRAKGLHTGTVEARLDIGDADGLRVALDELARYLAGKAPETLAALVALLKTLPLGYAPKIDLGGCDEGAAALAVVAALPGAYTGATARENGTPLYYAHAEVNGVEVTARHAPTPPRPTIAGAAGLDMAARAGGDR